MGLFVYHVILIYDTVFEQRVLVCGFNSKFQQCPNFGNPHRTICWQNVHGGRVPEINKGGYLFFYFFFQPGAAFLAICCILELKIVFCMHFGARISLVWLLWFVGFCGFCCFLWLLGSRSLLVSVVCVVSVVFVVFGGFLDLVALMI